MKKILVTGMALAMVSTAMAAEEKDTGRPIVELDEMVVSATKTEEIKKDVSNDVIILDALSIQDSPANGLGDLLGGETGIDWRTRGDYGGAEQTIQIRGMDADGTQVIVNGVTINSPSLGTTDVGRVPVNNIERIEVVKGSGSVLYGSGAMSGIVNIITKSPKHDEIILNASTGFGTENTYQVNAENGMFITDQFGYYLTASQRDTDGFRDNADATIQDASLKLIYEGSDAFNVQFYGDIIKQKNGIPGVVPPEGTQPFSVNGTLLYNGESANLLNHSENKDGHLVLKVDGDLTDWFGYNLQTDYTDMESDSYSRYYSSSKAGNLPGSHSIVTNKVYGLEGNVKFTPVENGILLMGIQYKDFDWENSKETFNGFGNIESTGNTENGLHTIGYFTEIHYRPLKYLKATAGVRYEDHSEFGSEVLPRFGLIVNPTDTTVIKFNTGKHYKAPTPNDLFWPSEDLGWGWSLQGNPDLQPETGYHTDIGVEQSFMDKKISASLTYFKWKIEDKIDWASNNKHYAPDNLDEYEADGFEAGLKVGPFYNTSLALSYTKTDAIEEAEPGIQRQAFYTPGHFFKASLTHWFDFGLDISAVYRYTSDRPYYSNDSDRVATTILDSYSTIDLKANQRIGDNWLVSLQVNNVFDEDYGTYVTNFTDSSTKVRTLSENKGAERSFFLSVKYEF